MTQTQEREPIGDVPARIEDVDTVLYSMQLPLDEDGDTAMVYVDATPEDDDRRRALATRVQALPDLLAALETIRGDIRGYFSGEWDGNAEGWEALADCAEAALAKAAPQTVSP